MAGFVGNAWPELKTFANFPQRGSPPRRAEGLLPLVELTVRHDHGHPRRMATSWSGKPSPWARKSDRRQGKGTSVVSGMLTIDGSQGEGGGQVLRSSLALSLVTGRPLVVEKIRAARKKPGLLRQHLTAVLAAAEVSGAEVEGAALGSRHLVFRPGRVRSGNYAFRVGTAGSATLVLQTVLPALLLAEGESNLTLEGGTHRRRCDRPVSGIPRGHTRQGPGGRQKNTSPKRLLRSSSHSTGSRDSHEAYHS